MFIKNFKLKSKRNSNIFIVETRDAEYILHSDVIVKYGITKGECEDQKFYQAVMESDNLIAFDLAVKYIASSLKTEKQIKDYLYKKQFNKQVIEQVIAKLKDYHIIDDVAFAEMYIKSNLSMSKNKAKQKLFSFGVNSSDVDEILQNFLEIDGCIANIKKFIKNQPLNAKNYQKLLRKLTYQGFSYETIKSCINQLNLYVEEDQ